MFCNSSFRYSSLSFTFSFVINSSLYCSKCCFVLSSTCLSSELFNNSYSCTCSLSSSSAFSNLFMLFAIFLYPIMVIIPPASQIKINITIPRALCLLVRSSVFVIGKLTETPPIISPALVPCIAWLQSLRLLPQQ